MLTKPRDDLPTLGAKIAILHGSGSFYVGPMDVVEVDAPRQLVTLHPAYWPPKNYIVYRPHREDPTPLQWNHVDDLSEKERADLIYHVDYQPRPGMEVDIRETEPQVFTQRAISGKVEPEIKDLVPPGLPMRAREAVPDPTLSTDPNDGPYEKPFKLRSQSSAAPSLNGESLGDPEE